MTELVLTVENESILPSLRKILNSLDGVKVKPVRKRKTGIELGKEDVAKGRIFTAKDGADLLRQCLE